MTPDRAALSRSFTAQNVLVSSAALVEDRQRPVFHRFDRWISGRPNCGATLWQGRGDSLRLTPSWVAMRMERAARIGRACRVCFPVDSGTDNGTKQAPGGPNRAQDG